MTQKKLSSLLLMVCCLGAISASAQSSAGVLSLNKGLKLQVDNTVKSVITMDMMGQAMEIISDIAAVKKIEVKEKKDTSYIISTITTKMTTTGSAMGQTFSFDSDKKEDMDSSEAGKMMKGQINVLKEVEINRAGMTTNLKKDTAASAEAGNPMMDIMKSMGGSNDDASATADAFQVLPKGKKSGDTWVDSTITEGLKTYKTYTIKGLKGKEATVALTGTQQSNKTIETQGMEITVNMESKLSGESIVDISTGVVKQRTFTMEGTGSADFMGQSVPMTTKVTTATMVKSL